MNNDEKNINADLDIEFDEKILNDEFAGIIRDGLDEAFVDENIFVSEDLIAKTMAAIGKLSEQDEVKKDTSEKIVALSDATKKSKKQVWRQVAGVVAALIVVGVGVITIKGGLFKRSESSNSMTDMTTVTATSSTSNSAMMNDTTATTEDASDRYSFAAGSAEGNVESSALAETANPSDYSFTDSTDSWYLENDVEYAPSNDSVESDDYNASDNDYNASDDKGTSGEESGSILTESGSGTAGLMGIIADKNDQDMTEAYSYILEEFDWRYESIDIPQSIDIDKVIYNLSLMVRGENDELVDKRILIAESEIYLAVEKISGDELTYEVEKAYKFDDLALVLKIIQISCE